MSSLEEGNKPIVKKRKRNVNNNNNNTNNSGIANKIWQWCMNCLKLKSKHLRVIIIFQVILLLFFSTLYVKGYHKDIWMYFSYYTRPLWDNAGPPPFEVIQHFYAEDVPIETLCQVNGWEFAGNNSHKLADAVIFSNELDLLEIRWRELMPYVDYFFIVESDKTFTNKPKELTFALNRERFAFAGSKVIYDVFVAPPVTEAEAREGFPLEGRLRNFMSQLIRKTLQNGDKLIMADVDEIPSRDTAKLLKYCDGYPEILHLGLRNYIYSFEFPITHQAGYVGISPGSYQWRPQVHKYDASTYYMHSQSSQYLLAEAGWHCSFCFRYIEDFVFKMTSYSHSDRVRHDNFLDHARIQKIVCDGTDIFEMPAESFTWYDVVLNFFATPKTQSVVHLPVQLVEHPKLYPFLLPGNCVREKKH